MAGSPRLRTPQLLAPCAVCVVCRFCRAGSDSCYVLKLLCVSIVIEQLRRKYTGRLKHFNRVLWPVAQPSAALAGAQLFNGGAPESAPGQNRASSWHGVRHLAVIGIDAMMLARLTQCVLSMLSACRCAYAHMTITYHALVLPPGCSLLPAHTGSSSSSILRAACASASFSSL